MIRRVIWLSIFGLLAACGGSSGETGSGGGGGAAPQEVCTYDFQADVKMGPSTGLSVKGKLALVQDDKNNIGGVVAPEGTEDDVSSYVKVSGTIQDTTVTMTLTMPDGTQIQGTGPLPAAPGTCAATDASTEGTLTGPQAGDSGDWATTTAGYLATFACAATCEFFHQSDHCDSYCANGRTG